MSWGDGQSETFTKNTAGSLGSRPHSYADNGNYTVTVTVADDTTSRSVTFAVNVANLAPVASVTGPSSAIPGQPVTFILKATDASPTDQSAGFRYTIDWGDGNPLQTTPAGQPGSGLAVPHTFSSSGSRTIRVSVIDKNLDSSTTATWTVNVYTILGSNKARLLWPLLTPTRAAIGTAAFSPWSTPAARRSMGPSSYTGLACRQA